MLKELYKPIQQCCATLRRSLNKTNVAGCWPMLLPFTRRLREYYPERFSPLKLKFLFPFAVITVRDNTCCVILRPFVRTCSLIGSWRSKRAQQLPTMLGVVSQQCCVRLHGAKSLTGFKLCATTRNNIQQHATGCANGRNM